MDAPSPLALVPLDDLLNELERRTTACVVACQWRQEGFVEQEDYATTTRIHGDFIHINGLTDYLRARAGLLSRIKLDEALRGVADETEEDDEA